MNHKGYTLISLLIGLMIMLIAIPITYNIYLLIYKMNDFSYTQTFNEQDSRLILNYITNEIGNAKAVTISTNQLLYTNKDNNSKRISYNSSEKAVKVYNNDLLILTLGQDNIASINFQNNTPSGTAKIQVKITILFVNGESITTNVMTMNDMT